MILERLEVGELAVNCYILAVSPDAQALIIDPGAEAEKIKNFLKRHNLKPAAVINTHGHFDHIGCDGEFGVPVYIHKEDSAMLTNPAVNFSIFATGKAQSVTVETRYLQDRQQIKLQGLELEVIHTPGHSRGGICLLLKKPLNNILFSGDTLFYMGVGRSDFPGASERALMESIKSKLFILPDETRLLPGHGPDSTIGREKNRR